MFQPAPVKLLCTYITLYCFYCKPMKSQFEYSMQGVDNDIAHTANDKHMIVSVGITVNLGYLGHDFIHVLPSEHNQKHPSVRTPVLCYLQTQDDVNKTRPAGTFVWVVCALVPVEQGCLYRVPASCKGHHTSLSTTRKMCLCSYNTYMCLSPTAAILYIACHGLFSTRSKRQD